jgi:hypothetical protein
MARNLAAVCLPPFWPKSPLEWFRAAEAQFVIRGIEEQLDRYYLVLATLAEPQIDRVRAIVEAELAAASYNQLRAALISKHTLMRITSCSGCLTRSGCCWRRMTSPTWCLWRRRWTSW